MMLTCKNHPELRWSCKEIAYTPGHGYNGKRSIFFFGQARLDEKGQPILFGDKSGTECDRVSDGKLVVECDCTARDLIAAPEMKEIRKYGK